MLDVGCGTGRVGAALAERGARAWGVEPDAQMAAAASKRLRVKIAPVEQLPFKDAWFERAVMWLVVHLVDRPRAFAELRRVLGADGRLVIATFDPAYFDRFWLNRFFPSIERIDRARFSSAADLGAELEAVGFGPVRLLSLSQRASVDREAALRKVRGRFISTLQMLDEDEYEAGLGRLERELPERVDYPVEWIVAVAYR